MQNFKLKALTLASALALAACGGSDNGSSNVITNPTNPGNNPTTPASELEQAKEMVRTAHLFINDGEAVSSAYENMSNILTSEQQSRVSEAMDVPQDLYFYMYQNNVTQLTAADIIALQNNDDFKSMTYPNTITPESDFIATLDSDYNFKLTGSASVETNNYEYVYNPNTNIYDYVETYEDTFDVMYDNFTDTLYQSVSSDNISGNIGFNKLTVGSGSDEVVFSSTSQGFQAQGKFTEAVVYDDEFDFSAAQEAGVLLEKATITLQDLKMVANDTVIEANDFEISAMDITNTLPDGTEAIQTVPYKFALTGKFKKQSPSTDVVVTLNMTANDEDIKNVVLIDENGDFQEANGEFVGMTVLLSAKGDLTKENSVVIPLDFQAKLDRTASDVITLESLNASIEGETLIVEGESNIEAMDDEVKTTLKVMQNNAYLTLKLDGNDDFVKDATGKVADIMVGDEDYGDLFDMNGVISAKFSDDSIITL